MFKHNVEYVDFNGTERKEDLYFHLSSVEVLRLEAEIGNTLDKHIEILTTNQKTSDLLAFLEKMLLSSYGKKTSDGRSFLKSETIRNEFEHSQAYAEVFEQILLNPELGRKFGEGVADNGKTKKNQVAPRVITDESHNG